MLLNLCQIAESLTEHSSYTDKSKLPDDGQPAPYPSLAVRARNGRVADYSEVGIAKQRSPTMKISRARHGRRSNVPSASNVQNAEFLKVSVSAFGDELLVETASAFDDLLTTRIFLIQSST
jgi:hypothetical protein